MAFGQFSDRQILCVQVRVSAQHFPILMPGDKRNFWNLIAGFEEAACRFMPQVVEAEIVNAEIATRATEGSASRPTAIGEYPSQSLGHQRLLC